MATTETAPIAFSERTILGRDPVMCERFTLNNLSVSYMEIKFPGCTLVEVAQDANGPLRPPVVCAPWQPWPPVVTAPNTIQGFDGDVHFFPAATARTAAGTVIDLRHDNSSDDHLFRLGVRYGLAIAAHARVVCDGQPAQVSRALDTALTLMLDTTSDGRSLRTEQAMRPHYFDIRAVASTAGVTQPRCTITFSRRAFVDGMADLHVLQHLQNFMPYPHECQFQSGFSGSNTHTKIFVMNPTMPLDPIMCDYLGVHPDRFRDSTSTLHAPQTALWGRQPVAESV